MFRQKKKKINSLKIKTILREGYIKILQDNDIKLEFSDSF